MTTPDSSATQWAWLARCRHPQGRKGEIFADILTDFPEKFAERKKLWLLAEQGSAGKSSLVPGHGSSPAAIGIPGSANERDVSRTTSRIAGFVTGNDLSRAENAQKLTGALAPAGNAPIKPSTANPPREVELIAHWLHKGGIVLHFAGIDSITAAETLKGLIVAIPAEQRAVLDEDEVYTGDLIGCTLVDVAGPAPVTVGEIEAVDRTAGPVALLVVQGKSGEVLVPFAKAFLRNIDLEAKRIEMALPEGLVALNAAG
jgi:16S rRNA processing protein RimM